jgi:hypothetical protein
VAGMLAASCLAVDAARADAGREPGRQAAAVLELEARPGDVVIALDARSYFPLRYYLDRGGWLATRGVRLLEWHRPGEAFYAGWQDIEASDRLEECELERVGWGDALSLRPSAAIWLVSLVDPAKDFGGLPSASTASLRFDRTIRVDAGGKSGRIVLAVPATTTAARPGSRAWGGPRRDGKRSARRNLGPASFGRSENRSSRSGFRGPSGQDPIYLRQGPQPTTLSTNSAMECVTNRFPSTARAQPTTSGRHPSSRD